MSEPLLQARDLWVGFRDGGPALLRGLDLEIPCAGAVGLVGPSGCGKSLTVRALCGLLPAGTWWRGDVVWRGTQLSDPDGATWRGVRGSGLTLMIQEPQAGLNPVLKAGEQVAESVRRHQGCDRKEAWRRTVALLAEVRLPDPESDAHRYPHQLSGGMRQRVLLAAALACNPDLLIADEPTTALDPTVQKRILQLLDRIRRERGMALLFISHDRPLVERMSDRTLELHDGMLREVEHGGGDSSADKVRAAVPAAAETAFLAGDGLTVRYGRTGGAPAPAPALVEVDVRLYRGRAVGLAGESGCGKTTLARTLSLQGPAPEGSLRLEGQDLLSCTGPELRRARRRIQVVFQDAGESLDPRQRVGAALAEAAGDDRVFDPDASLAEVGLASGLGERFPHQLSGGQRQRVALARCLAADPDVLVADEITSSLDEAARAGILDLLRRVMVERRLALLLISHQLSILHDLCGRVMVMLDGLVLEVYSTEGGAGPRHPYTRELLAAAPDRLGADPACWASDRTRTISCPGSERTGCPWVSACPYRKEHCGMELPMLKNEGDGCFLRCPEA